MNIKHKISGIKKRKFLPIQWKIKFSSTNEKSRNFTTKQGKIPMCKKQQKPLYLIIILSNL